MSDDMNVGNQVNNSDIDLHPIMTKIFFFLDMKYGKKLMKKISKWQIIINEGHSQIQDLTDISTKFFFVFISGIQIIIGCLKEKYLNQQ